MLSLNVHAEQTKLDEIFHIVKIFNPHANQKTHNTIKTLITYEKYKTYIDQLRKEYPDKPNHELVDIYITQFSDINPTNNQHHRHYLQVVRNFILNSIDSHSN